MNKHGLPPEQGLYDPRYEHDACGIGFVADIKGRRSQQIVQQGIEVLVNLEHRGACGCDPETGDGAGLLLQIPHEFFAGEAERLGFELPERGAYGVGMLFLSKNENERLAARSMVQRVAREEGLQVLGWRQVPVNSDAIGWLARESEPRVDQVFIARAEGSTLDADAFERKLYITRRRAFFAAKRQELSRYYPVSMSSRTICYKGLLIAPQIPKYYPDLSNPRFQSAIALIHQRFSTNTFPTWERAQPFRFLAHNGEINTLRGNINWMRARESAFSSPLFGDDIKKLFPVIDETGSDSAMADNALELLIQGGRATPHAMMMMIPEAWDQHRHMPDYKKAFYEFHAMMLEPWDGPASMVFTDGRYVGGTLDRNGLRPSRYWVTHDDQVVMASETGVLPIRPENVRYKGRLQPGRMFLVDTAEGRIVEDDEIKETISKRKPYRQWLNENLIEIEKLPEPQHVFKTNFETLLTRQRAFGYTLEDQRIVLGPMARQGQEPVGSMGVDIPLACLSDRPQLLFNYFKQLFAQVTNPAIDSIREELVMSSLVYVGPEGNLLDETPEHAHLLKLPTPLLTNRDLEKLRAVGEPGSVEYGGSNGDGVGGRIRFGAKTLKTGFAVKEGAAGLEKALDALCRRAEQAAHAGYSVLILSDRGVIDENTAPIPSLLALGAVHQHLIRTATRGKVGLIVESGEPREVMHFCLLIGYGASAINPFLAFETIEHMHQEGLLPEDLSPEQAQKNYISAIKKGILKVMSKMGISTVQSYHAAQIFEAVGVNRSVIDRYFTGTTSQIEGVGLDVIAAESAKRHEYAFQRLTDADTELDVGGEYQFRVRGEKHLLNPDTVSKLQHAVQQKSYKTFKEFSDTVNDLNRTMCTLRGLFDFKWADQPVPLEEVEPASEIVRRFCTGAMSFGSISKEAHETLAIAMNRIGGRSNTGEGGEDPARFKKDPNGDWRRSAIKQVASARFGVTANYLVNADELQIKISQGAKPGEGGQLPGHKVDEFIAWLRHSTPGVGLISPPPHHDIYSIEDLAQLIFDLKNSNTRANVSVKLVSEVGVGTVAAGVAKAHADLVLISGHDGGTGASPISSIRHAGTPWELGLSETQQVLVMNDLRSRIKVQVDGKLQTGRDIVIGALLGAEEFGFSTMPLITLGCIMMRKCHLNTCPVGIATQDPELRKKFAGAPENAINFFFFVAEEAREIMAKLGFRRIEEMVGRVDRLDVKKAVDHWKAKGLDFSRVFFDPPVDRSVPRHQTRKQDHGIENQLDNQLIQFAKQALEKKTPVEIKLPIRNINRTVGTMLSSEIARRYAEEGLPDDTIRCHFTGSAGQSFGAWASRGLTMTLEGDANDYFGKGLSGGRLIVYPSAGSNFVFEENIIIGNVSFYGATGGEAYINGMAGERFCIRNSGATVVVEGVGDHGCEYMTNGRAIILGRAGRNFAAGMSGGIAFVLDEAGDFAEKACNHSMVDLEPFAAPEDIVFVRHLIERHLELTRSPKAEWILGNWEKMLPKFIKVYPKELKRALHDRQQREMVSAAGGG